MSTPIDAISARGVSPMSALSFESGADGTGSSASAGAFATSMSGAI